MRASYSGRRGRAGEWLVFRGDGPLSPRRSLRVINHSPTGFSWGFGGSGPAQLALALLLDVAGEKTALRYYQRFKWEVVGHWPQEGPWSITVAEILRWLSLQPQREDGRREAMAASIP